MVLDFFSQGVSCAYDRYRRGTKFIGQEKSRSEAPPRGAAYSRELSVARNAEIVWIRIHRRSHPCSGSACFPIYLNGARSRLRPSETRRRFVAENCRRIHKARHHSPPARRGE